MLFVGVALSPPGRRPWGEYEISDSSAVVGFLVGRGIVRFAIPWGDLYVFAASMCENLLCLRLARFRRYFGECVHISEGGCVSRFMCVCGLSPLPSRVNLGLFRYMSFV